MNLPRVGNNILLLSNKGLELFALGYAGRSVHKLLLVRVRRVLFLATPMNKMWDHFPSLWKMSKFYFVLWFSRWKEHT